MSIKKTRLDVDNLKAAVEDNKILRGISLKIKSGEVHVVMGPNGSGKSTLAAVLMGHPSFVVSGGVSIDGENLLEMSPDERAKKGLFLAFQYPVGVPGVSVQKFLWSAYKALNPNTKRSVLDFRKEMKELSSLINIDEGLLKRSINEGFSGGEKKKVEVLQLLMLKPKIGVLDEVDSGLDIDAIKMVAGGINKAVSKGVGVVLITHYQRILKYINPDFVHVMEDGKIVKSGGEELVEEIEKSGYSNKD